jgi:diaminobutyrate-2-oxoglutarate transaminase
MRTNGSKDPTRFDDLHFDDAPAVAGPVPGPRSRELLEEQAELESRARSYPRSVPIALEEGRGATMRDVDGNTFVDFFGGAGTLNVGHSNPAVLAAAADQQQRLVHALDFPTRPRLRLLRRLKGLLPGRLRRTARFHLGGPTGTDAVEAALKLTRAHTGRSGVIAFQGSYHGMAVTSDLSYARPEATPVQYMPYPYCYRCPLGLKRTSCGLACAKLVETALSDPHSGTPTPAAVLMEPIQGEGGTVIPPPGYLDEIRRISSEHEVPLIFDEIQSGLGRTGAMFACEHDDVTPDALTISKALGGAGYPISLVAYDDELDTWEPGAHIGTFRGHQVAMAAGSAALDFMEERDVVQHAAELGELALTLLKGASGEIESIGDVRGRGLMIGVELVRDRETKEPWPELAAELRSSCCERGLIIEVGGHHSNVARFLPPLVISRTLLLRGLEIFLDTLMELERVAPPTQVVTPLRLA